MEAVEGDGAAYGYVKLTHWLRQEYGLVINKKKVYRLCKELDILRPQREIRRRPPRVLARSHEVTGPNQVWEADLKYGYIAGEDRFFYVLSVLDVYDRSVVGYHVGRRCEARHAVWALRQALALRKPDGTLVLRTDNGPQFVSEVFHLACTELGVEHERIPSRTPNMNAHVEAYHRILEEECLSRYEFESFAEAYAAVTQFVAFYNHRRLHSGLHYLPPAMFLREHEERGLTPVKAVRV